MNLKIFKRVLICSSRKVMSKIIKVLLNWVLDLLLWVPNPTLTTYRHAVLMALRHLPSSHPIVSHTPYGLFWCVWVSVGCVYHVSALRDSCQSIQGETCRLNTLSRALYLTPGWFNPTPYTHIHTPIHKHTPAYTPASPVIHQYLHRGPLLIPSTQPLHPLQYNIRAKTTSVQV